MRVSSVLQFLLALAIAAPLPAATSSTLQALSDEFAVVAERIKPSVASVSTSSEALFMDPREGQRRLGVLNLR